MPGVFAELKNFGTKIIKFKQGKVLDNDVVFFSAIGASLQGLPFEVKGLCAALTMGFLSDMLKFMKTPNNGGLMSELLGEQLTRFTRDAGTSSKNPGNAKLASAAVEKQQFYVKEASAGGGDPFGNLAFQEGLIATTELISPDSLQADFLKDAFNWIMHGTAYYLSLTIDVNGKSAGHGVGLVRGNMGVYFFDPNIGGYLVPDATFNRFFEAYLKALKTYKWEYKSAVVRKYKLVFGS